MVGPAASDVDVMTAPSAVAESGTRMMALWLTSATGTFVATAML